MSDEQFISGIFNYCDRWCERCAFTARCRNYAMELEFRKAEEDGRDREEIDWEAFWNRVGLSYDRTPPEWLGEFDLAEDEPEFDLGITFTEADQDDLERQLDEAVDAHPLNVRAHQYAAATHQWLRRHTDERSQTLQDDADPRLTLQWTSDDLPVSDALAVVGWYHTLIAAKLNRALSGMLENEHEHEPWLDSLPPAELEEDDLASAIHEANASDAAGSAKVALISIERSIGGWTVLRTARPDLEDSIAPLQRLLGWLRVQTDRLIPDARTFHRPGFDD